MTKDIESIDESLFESIKHINEYGMEYWTARELLKVLQYGEYRFFSKVIDKAIDACIASKNDVRDHFVHVHEMVNIGSSAKRRAVLCQRIYRLLIKVSSRSKVSRKNF